MACDARPAYLGVRKPCSHQRLKHGFSRGKAAAWLPHSKGGDPHAAQPGAAVLQRLAALAGLT